MDALTWMMLVTSELRNLGYFSEGIRKVVKETVGKGIVGPLAVVFWEGDLFSHSDISSSLLRTVGTN
jgi:hypothetical protein